MIRLDVRCAAHLVVKRHGADAPIVTAQRVDEILTEGLDGVEPRYEPPHKPQIAGADRGRGSAPLSVNRLPRHDWPVEGQKDRVNEGVTILDVRALLLWRNHAAVSGSEPRSDAKLTLIGPC